MKKDERSNPAAAETSCSLSSDEAVQLRQCEHVLERGLATFFEVGSALLSIRNERLYRATHDTFERYCRQRWGIGRSYASRVIGAAERLKLLPEVAASSKPANEFQMRPFLKVEPTSFPKLWDKVLKKAKQGEITSGLICEVIAESLPRGRSVRRKKTGPKRIEKALLAQLLILLQDAKTRTEKGERDQVLAVLERIETLICSP